jgi:hypothetical protein
MIDGFSQSQVIAALVALLVASYAAFFGWIVSSIHRLDAKIDALDLRLNTKIDALTVAVSRLEGAVYHGLPEPRGAAE